MSEIICPHCNKAFTIDENDYAKLIAQVRTKEFAKEIHDKLQSESERQQAAFEMDKQDIIMKHNTAVAEKDKEIERLRARLDNADNEKRIAVKEAVEKKDAEIIGRDQQIVRLRAEIENKEKEKELAVTQAVTEKGNEITELRSKLVAAGSEKALAVSQAVKIKDDELNKKDREIIELRSSIEMSDSNKKLALTQLEQKKDNELAQKNSTIQSLTSTIEQNEQAYRLKEQSLRSQFEVQLKQRDEEIERYKDFKQRLSTKMIGETLEQHCSIQFNQYRALAFPNAYFEKDNDASSGSKGDFIYRDYSDDNTEYISIMFEMKNEADTTAAKHKNEDFFKELDKDRNEKKCEYAVLVSMLESDSELYNNGIVDVSHRYPKMYVIRPQFFIPIITLLRNAALNALDYKRQLNEAREQQIDLTNFESNIDTFKNSFMNTYTNAVKKHQEAIDEIDKAIARLTKVKEALQMSDKHLNTANNKLTSDLTIKRLTKNADSVYDKLMDIRENSGGEPPLANRVVNEQ